MPPPPAVPPPTGAALPPPPGLAPKTPPQFPPPPGLGAAGKAPPPFPVVAPPKSGKTMPPIPHIAATEEPVIPEENVPEKKVPIWKKKVFQLGALAALLVLGGGGFFMFRKPAAPPPLPKPAQPKPAATPVAPKAGAAAAPAPELANKPAQSTPGLSPTQNAIAHAPVNAVNKAKDVIAKREGSGQGRDAVGAITDGDGSAADKPAATKPAAPQTVATSSTIAPGVSATNDNISAAAEASPAFRSFVANAKITGVFPTATPPRVLINGRTVRGGDVVENALAITFDSIDAEKKLILFKDKAGAIVTRRY